MFIFLTKKNFAFVENNEIAYVLCEENCFGDNFLLALCHAIFNNYETIVFEADDIDPIAFRLKNIFLDGFVEKRRHGFINNLCMAVQYHLWKYISGFTKIQI